MGREMESVWKAMKASQYQRTLEMMEREMEAATDLKTALNVVLRRVVKVTNAVTGTFWFYDMYGDGRIHPAAVSDNQGLLTFSLEPGEGIAGQVIQNGRGVIIRDCRKHPQWSNRADSATGFETKTMICAPMHFREFTFGCIQIINRKDDMPFDEKDLLFVETLASYSSRMFEKLRFLDKYAAASIEKPVPVITSAHGYSFGDLFSLRNYSEVEAELYHTKQMMRLTEKQQETVMRLSQEIWEIFMNAGRDF